MLLQLLFFAVVVVHAHANVISADKFDHSEAYVRREFDRFQRTYNKQYSSHEEFQHRFDCFNRTLYEAQLLNGLDATATYGVNAFADLCSWEFKQMYLSNPAKVRAYPPNHFCNNQTQITPSGNLFPSGWDWRKKGGVTPIGDQGQCADDWVFSSVACMETAWFVHTQKLVPLSVGEVMQCAEVGGNERCNGGWPENVFEWVIKNGGIDSAKDYPYNGKPFGQCDKSKLAKHVAEFNLCWYLPRSETKIATWLKTHGAVSVFVDGVPWQTYNGGIATANCAQRVLDHAVTLVGFGEEKGMKYWIVKNSWGDWWGEKGYIRFKFGVNCFGVMDQASAITNHRQA